MSLALASFARAVARMVPRKIVLIEKCMIVDLFYFEKRMCCGNDQGSFSSVEFSGKYGIGGSHGFNGAWIQWMCCPYIHT